MNANPTQRRNGAAMLKTILTVAAIVVVWILLQRYILPRLGVPT